MKNTPSVVSIAGAVFFLLAACGLSSTSALVGSQGGSVSLGQALTMDVPPGAVSDDTVIELTEVEARHAGDREFEVHPDGLELSQPAQVEIEAEHSAQVTETENETEHAAENQTFEAGSHRMRCTMSRLGHVTLHSSGADDAADAGAEMEMQTEADGGSSGSGSGSKHGGSDSP